MTYCEFNTRTYAKWILAGEHAVVRGHSALAFPLKSRQLCLDYQATGRDLTAEFTSDAGEDMHLLFWTALEQGMQQLGRSINALEGHFSIQSNIPIGRGMGASAALSVALGRWFVAQGLLEDTALYGFSKSIEDRFHGSSSGLDIAAVMSETGMDFAQGESRPLSLNWQPHWYLSSCNQMGITSHCVSHVQKLWQSSPEQALAIDQKMQKATLLAKEALEKKDAIRDLAQAIHLAASCFEDWGLLSEDLKQHMQQLSQQGAVAVKPTGSGGGGYVLSLWERAQAMPGLIPV